MLIETHFLALEWHQLNIPVNVLDDMEGISDNMTRYTMPFDGYLVAMGIGSNRFS